MSIKDLYKDFGIPYWTEGKNVSKGWINTTCPWCDDPSNHLGFNGKIFNCWRCGKHSIIPTLEKILRLPRYQVEQIIEKYNIFEDKQFFTDEKVTVRNKSLKLPTNLINELPRLHRNYLLKRNFDPDKIQQIWNVKATGPISSLDGVKYKNRLFIPIYWNGEMVSFQTRDVTDKQDKRYMACLVDREIIHHKDILYAKQEELTNKVVVVEGVPDVWRLGPNNAVATYGTGFTLSQIRHLSRFSRVFIMYDPEFYAQKKAKKLKKELVFRGTNTTIIDEIPAEDPAALTDKQTEQLLKYLGFR